MKVFDNDDNDHLICPYCEQNNLDEDCLLITDGDTFTFNCHFCANDFVGEVSMVPTYRTARTSCEEHKLKKCCMLTEKDVFYQCQDCKDEFYSGKMPEKYTTIIEEEKK